MTKAGNATTTRRAALATIAAGAAAATAAPGLALANTSDAEILAIGSELDRIWPRYEFVLELHNKIADEAYDLAAARLGLTTEAGHESRRFRQAWNAACHELGLAPLADELDANGKRCDEIVERLRQRPAKTWDGVVVLARTLVRLGGMENLWQKPFEDLDRDEQLIRLLVDGVESANASGGQA